MKRLVAVLFCLSYAFAACASQGAAMSMWL